jgi:hypothetical protein
MDAAIRPNQGLNSESFIRESSAASIFGSKDVRPFALSLSLTSLLI